MEAPHEVPTIWSSGSSTRPLGELVALLERYGVTTLADVRMFPYSRRFPHFSKSSLEATMPLKSLRYVYLGKELGGFRRGGFGAYTQTAEFARGIEALEAAARDMRTAFMCCERLPSKCHRRFIASALERRGWSVIHIIEKDVTWPAHHPPHTSHQPPITGKS